MSDTPIWKQLWLAPLCWWRRFRINRSKHQLRFGTDRKREKAAKYLIRLGEPGLVVLREAVKEYWSALGDSREWRERIADMLVEAGDQGAIPVLVYCLRSYSGQMLIPWYQRLAKFFPDTRVTVAIETALADRDCLEVRRAAADAATEAARRVMADQTGVDQFEAAAREIEKALS